MKIMQYVPKDVVVEKLAINLDFNDIINYCKTSKKYNKIICNNNIFWHKYIHNKFNIKCESVDIKRLQNIAYWLDYLEKNKILSKEGITFYKKIIFPNDTLVHNNYRIRLFLFYEWYKFWEKEIAN